MFVHKMKSELIEIVKTHVHPHKRISALTYLNSMGAHISDVVIPLIHDESRSIEARDTDLLILSSMDSEHHDVMREIVFDDVDLPSEIRELGLVLLSGNSTDDELCPMSAQQRYRDIIYDLIPRTLSRLRLALSLGARSG
jgi:hypothetical protein